MLGLQVPQKSKNRRVPVWDCSELIAKMYQDRIAEFGNLSRGNGQSMVEGGSIGVLGVLGLGKDAGKVPALCRDQERDDGAELGRSGLRL
jgi:hypothetical protein